MKDGEEEKRWVLCPRCAASYFLKGGKLCQKRILSFVRK